MQKPCPSALAKFQANEGASTVRIREVEAELGLTLPPDYVAFLQQANGGEGPVGTESYVILWPVEELVERNRRYRPDAEYAADLTFIGTDGGNEAFAIRHTDGHYVHAPLIGMRSSEVDDMGATFKEFLRALR